MDKEKTKMTKIEKIMSRGVPYEKAVELANLPTIQKSYAIRKWLSTYDNDVKVYKAVYDFSDRHNVNAANISSATFNVDNVLSIRHIQRYDWLKDKRLNQQKRQQVLKRELNALFGVTKSIVDVVQYGNRIDTEYFVKLPTMPDKWTMAEAENIITTYD